MERSPVSKALQTQEGYTDASLSPRALGAFSAGQEHIKSAPETGEAKGVVKREREQSPTGPSTESQEFWGCNPYPPYPGTVVGACCPFGSPAPPSPLQDEPIALDKQHSRDAAAITHSTYSLPASSYSQDPVYVNGGLNYSYRGYGALGSNLQPPASLQTGNHSNGECRRPRFSGSLTSTQPVCTIALGRGQSNSFVAQGPSPCHNL